MDLPHDAGAAVRCELEQGNAPKVAGYVEAANAGLTVLVRHG